MKVFTRIAHAALQPLRLTVRYALSQPAFTPLLAFSAVGHRSRFGTVGPLARASGFLFASRVLRVSAFDAFRHEMAVLAAGRILVTEQNDNPQLGLTGHVCFTCREKSINLWKSEGRGLLPNLCFEGFALCQGCKNSRSFLAGAINKGPIGEVVLGTLEAPMPAWELEITQLAPE